MTHPSTRSRLLETLYAIKHLVAVDIVVRHEENSNKSRCPYEFVEVCRWGIYKYSK